MSPYKNISTYYYFFNLAGTGMQVGDAFSLSVGEEYIATADWNSTYQLTESHVAENKWGGRIRINGIFLGWYYVFVWKLTSTCGAEGRGFDS